MRNWKECTTYTHIDEETRKDIHTVRQWALMGYVPLEGSTGTILYSNGYKQAKFTYYHRDEVRIGNRLETLSHLAPKRTAYDIERASMIREKAEETRKFKLYRKECRKIAHSVPVNDKPSLAIVIDTETTGLDSSCDEVLQLSIVNADTGYKIFDEYFKPVKAKSWKEAERVNGITPRKVANKPDIQQRIKEIQTIINNAHTIIGYNTDFDIGFLEDSGIHFSDTTNIVDVMEDYSPEHWVKLTECANELGYDWGKTKAHNALSDCRATLYCYNKLNGKEK